MITHIKLTGWDKYKDDIAMNFIKKVRKIFFLNINVKSF